MTCITTNTLETGNCYDITLFVLEPLTTTSNEKNQTFL